MIPFGQQQFDDQLAISAQLRRVGANHHAFLDRGHAGGLELLLSFDFDHAQAAGSDVAQAADVAEARNVNAVLPGNGENRIAAAARDHLVVDLEGIDAHAGTSSVLELMWQWPAGQRFSRICAAYSAGKYFNVLTTGLGAVWPSPQRLVSRSKSRSEEHTS